MATPLSPNKTTPMLTFNASSPLKEGSIFGLESDPVSCGSPIPIPYPWADDAVRANDYKYLEKLRGPLLKLISMALNRTMNLNYSERQWEVMLGQWLPSTMSIYLDRLRIIESAIKAGGGRQIRLNVKSQAPCLDTREFVKRAAADDNWNIWLMSRVVRASQAFPASSFCLRDLLVAEKKVSRANFRRVIRVSVRGLRNFLASAPESFRHGFFLITRPQPSSGHSPSTVVFQTSYFSRKILRLLMRDGRPMRPVRRFSSSTKKSLFDRSLRRELDYQVAKLLVSEDDLVSGFMINLSVLLPTSMLEGFKLGLARSRARNAVPGKIFSDNGHFYDDEFKRWSGDAVGRGAQLVIAEHGGSFRNVEVDFQFQHRIANQWVSPWPSDEDSAATLPLARTLGYQPPRSLRSRKRLLIVPYEVHKWAIRASAQPQSLRGLITISQACGLLEMLPDNIVRNAVLKRQLITPLWPLPWEIFRTQELRGLEHSFKPLRLEARRARLAVCTYPETTYLELMLAEVPTLLLFKQSVSGVDPAGQSLLNQMEKHGLAFRSHHAAAAHINQIWRRVSEWWSSVEVLEVRKAFASYIALPDDMSVLKWRNFLFQ